MIRVILIDFYGLFLPDAFTSWLEVNGKKREGIFAELILQANKDELDERTFLDNLSKEIGRTVTRNEIHSQSHTPNEELIKLVEDLAKRYTIILFSNASRNLRSKLSRLGIDTLFHDVIISSEIGHAKPSDEAFEVAIKRAGVPPREILFIDDTPENVEAGIRNGVNSLKYSSVEVLRQDIKHIL